MGAAETDTAAASTGAAAVNAGAAAMDSLDGECAAGEDMSQAKARRPHGGFAADARMEAIELIRTHPLYKEHLARLAELERERVFCCHGIDHLLDAARIAWIFNLEYNLGFRKEVVYAAALMHDIGKDEQYEHGTPHEEASARIAREIMADMGEAFDEVERDAIATAILEHRRLPKGASLLGAMLYDADKASRKCFACSVREDCSWSSEKMNLSARV